jgi:hypothetical protein
MAIHNARELINQAVMSWPDVSVATHRFGGLEWRIDKTEIGHIHGNHQIDIVLPSKIRDELVASGRAEPHHIYPQIGITFYIEQAADIEQAIELLRISYDLVQERRERLAKHVHSAR